jgi:hypothetical protein
VSICVVSVGRLELESLNGRGEVARLALGRTPITSRAALLIVGSILFPHCIKWQLACARYRRFGCLRSQRAHRHVAAEEPRSVIHGDNSSFDLKRKHLEPTQIDTACVHSYREPMSEQRSI